MHDNASSSGSHSTTFFSSVLQQTHALLTPKRAGYTLLGAFAFVGTAAALSMAAASPGNSSIHSLNLKTQNTTVPEVSDTSSSVSSAQSSSSSDSGNQSQVHLNVNGKDIPVPSNGSVQQTVPTTDGNGQSSVSVNTSSNGGASNSSSSSLNVNVHSDSVSSGNSFTNSTTFVDQNGGTTFISTSN